MPQSINTIKQIENCPADAIPDDVLASTQPLLLKGLVAHWPVVKAGKQSEQSAAAYITRFDRDIPLTAYEAPSNSNGRIFYNEDYSGFNFERTRLTLKQVLQKIFRVIDQPHAPTYYVGSTVVDHWLPGFRNENDIEIGDSDCLVSIWLGNRSRIAAHYDFPNNIACSLVGRRKFTLFPPNQAENLYVGPLEFTPSGQPISLVDTCHPDLVKFPKYQRAIAASITVELDPGDALLIPSMWWHHVESLQAFNVLVNYWWRSTPPYQGSPTNALHHAIMSLRELPVEQRRVWKNLFELYVFSEEKELFDHIPQHVKGVLGEVDEASAKALKAHLIKFLN